VSPPSQAPLRIFKQQQTVATSPSVCSPLSLIAVTSRQRLSLPGQHKPLPSELRPADVLFKTVRYLMVDVAGRAMRTGVPGGLAHDYAFLADRLR
jgi:hypothetical protein